jgi:NADPH:quinone reductase-like Zn-dependent oxidoreductase
VLPLQSTHEGSSPHQLRASGRGSGLDVDKPTIKGDEVLVKVHATTVNRTGCAFRAAKPFVIRFLTGLTRPRVTVLGGEFAGVVEAVGSPVTSFKVGDRVFGYCEGSWGAHAEYLSMPADGPLAAMRSQRAQLSADRTAEKQKAGLQAAGTSLQRRHKETRGGVPAGRGELVRVAGR